MNRVTSLFGKMCIRDRGMRILEKMAVKIGGGVNHRIGLFDMILLKDNHVDFAGGIDKAINLSLIHIFLARAGRREG